MDILLLTVTPITLKLLSSLDSLDTVSNSPACSARSWQTSHLTARPAHQSDSWRPRGGCKDWSRVLLPSCCFRGRWQLMFYEMTQYILGSNQSHHDPLTGHREMVEAFLAEEANDAIRRHEFIDGHYMRRHQSMYRRLHRSLA